MSVYPGFHIRHFTRQLVDDGHDGLGFLFKNAQSLLEMVHEQQNQNKCDTNTQEKETFNEAKYSGHGYNIVWHKTRLIPNADFWGT